MFTILWLALLAGATSPTIPTADDKKEEPYIEIDFTRMPKGTWMIDITVEFTDADLTFTDDFETIKGLPNKDDMCVIIAKRMNSVKVKAEVVDKTKIRVYGRTFKDKFYKVTKGKVESKELKKDQLPTVKYVGKKA